MADGTSRGNSREAVPQATDLVDTYRAFLRGMQDIQFSEDSYAQGALNGQFYLARVRGWEPVFRATLADVLAFHGAVHHKLYWMRRIVTYAAQASDVAATGTALAKVFDGNFAGLSAEAAAERYFRTALDLDPDCARALFNLGSLAGDRGEVDGAIAFFDRAAAVQKFYLPFADLRAAMLLQASGRGTEAGERWKRAAASGRQFGQLHYNVALGLREAGDVEAALAEMDRCLDCAHLYAPEFTEMRLPLPDFHPINPIAMHIEGNEPPSAPPRRPVRALLRRLAVALGVLHRREGAP